MYTGWAISSLPWQYQQRTSTASKKAKEWNKAFFHHSVTSFYTECCAFKETVKSLNTGNSHYFKQDKVTTNKTWKPKMPFGFDRTKTNLGSFDTLTHTHTHTHTEWSLIYHNRKLSVLSTLHPYARTIGSSSEKPRIIGSSSSAATNWVKIKVKCKNH